MKITLLVNPDNHVSKCYDSDSEWAKIYYLEDVYDRRTKNKTITQSTYAIVILGFGGGLEKKLEFTWG